jgi:methylmalonyl-CoA mutase cobalamin-binding subunit
VSYKHPIQVVSRLSGLSPHVIRVWEKRYGAVTPVRTGTNRRLYSEEEIQRLRLLSRATAAGHRIGIIAQLGLPDLERLVAALGSGLSVSTDLPGEGVGTGAAQGPMRLADGVEDRNGSAPGSAPGVAGGADGGLVRAALEATRAFSSTDLVGVLEQGAVRFGHNGVLHRVIGPLAREVGEMWQRGEATAAHEHFASALIRDFLARSARPFAIPEGAPRLVVATPSGQLHELGAVIVAAAASNLGWRVIYLGANLPAVEIAGAALQNGVRAVLLSLVYPADDRQLVGELAQLRRCLPTEVSIVCGGRAVWGYAETLRGIGALMPSDLPELCGLLGSLRNGSWERNGAPVVSVLPEVRPATISSAGSGPGMGTDVRFRGA